MAAPASSWVSHMGRSMGEFFRRHDFVPWFAGVTLFVALGIGIWTVVAAETVGLPGLIFVSGIAILCFISFYGLATGAFARPATPGDAAARGAYSRISELGVVARALDQAPEAYLITNRLGAVVYANRAYEALTRSGHRGRNLGRPLPLEQVFAGDEDLAAPLYRLARAARRGRQAMETLRLHGPGGRESTFDAQVNRLDGDPDHVVWRIQEKAPPAAPDPEVLELRAETVSSASASLGPSPLLAGAAGAHGTRLAALLDGAPLGVALLSDDGTIQGANRALDELTSGTVVVGAAFADLFTGEDQNEIKTRLQRLATGPVPPIEVGLGGDSRPVQLYLAPIDAPGAAYAAYLFDLSQQKSLEVQFAQSQKMQAVGQLAGGVAHDFNNLLTAIIGFCDLLLTRHTVGDPSFDDIDQIRQNANRAANLVRQLLAFSRQQTLTPKVLSPTDVLTDISMLLRRLLGENVELELTHGRNLGLIKADQNQLDTALINLAVNARDAMPDGGRLDIRTANFVQSDDRSAGHHLIPPGRYVLFEVKDTGSGIPEENLAKIFEPFFTTKDVGKGTGLGLSTVYGIIKQMDGFIFPESDLGTGTTFRIYLPVYQPTDGEVRDSARAAAKTGPRDLTGIGTILLVEDEDAVRAFAKRALKSRGYTVLEARHGGEALSVMDDHDGPIDLVVSDVVMPEMDGPTLAARVREQRPETKIIFISGYAEDTFKKNLGRPEDVAFLAKPFSLKQLAAKVKDVLTDEA